MMPTKSHLPHGTKRRSGFTIIELLVAAAITAVLAGILLGMTNGVLRSWNRTAGSLSANAQAQLIFSILAEDLESSLYRKDGGIWLAADILHNYSVSNLPAREWSDITGNYKPDGLISQNRTGRRIADCRYGSGGVWLRFFTASEGKEPRAVAYQIARRKITGDPTQTNTQNPAEIRYMLYRSEEASLVRGYDLDPTVSPLSTTGYPSISSIRLMNPRGSDVIGNNVIDFGVRFYQRSGGLYDPLFPISGNNWSNTEYQYLAGSANNPYPDAVDVMVRILTEEGAKQIANLEAGRIPDGGDFDETWWQIAIEHSKVFTQRIYINTRPL